MGRETMKTTKKDILSIRLASPETIYEWSHGEVMKPETINYRTLKAEFDGLFCERIFGPTKNYQCRCGKPRRQKDEGYVCEVCGVEITHSTVRRERMGHIKLAKPVVHYWYFKQNSYVSNLLDMKVKDIERVVYCQSYVILDPKDVPLEKKQLLTEKECAQVFKEFGSDCIRVGIGGEAIKELLKEIDLDELSNELKTKLKDAKKTGEKEIIKRLTIVEDFRKSGNRPEWMVLDVLPVLPADLRPLVQLDGGRFATSDLNELYRRVINRNNRLKILIESEAPSIIIENEVRMVQAAVDSVIANQRKSTNAVVGANKRKLKSLSSYLEGKGGRFRQNLLGKRVDYSGRSVIISGPKLKLHQVGIPREMALELFKPFVMGQMVKMDYAKSAKQANKKMQNRTDKMWDVLEKIVRNHPVLLNRAPTLHRLSIRAFEPVIVEGKAIRLHPLVCSAFNADYDGDTMSVHVPISREAQAEARVLLMATKNLLHPQSGKASASPSQDMVLGSYYISLEKQGAKGEGKYFASMNELLNSYYNKYVDIHAKVIVDVSKDEKFEGNYLVTTVGKVQFNQHFPKELPFVNNGVVDFSGKVHNLFDSIEDALQAVKDPSYKPFSSNFLNEYVSEAFNEYGEDVNVELLDAIKDVGFASSTKSGLTFSLQDIALPPNKEEIIQSVSAGIEKMENHYQYGRVSKNDRYEYVIKCWEQVSKEVADAAMTALENSGFNPIEMMMSSGARGSKNQYRQLAAMRALMADPSGRAIERPILKNFKEGLDEIDYFISSHGARKGLADTAIKTADAGYLTRRLVDVSHDLVVREDDCGTDEYIMISTIDPQIKPPTEMLEERVIGRVLAKDLLGENGEILFAKGTLVNPKQAKEINRLFKEVPIRSALKCKAERGICKQCYGYDLSSNTMVEKGEAVGVIAAQSIGEPGTQLTMRTFHAGGVAGNDITQGLPRITEILEARKTIKGEATLTTVAGVVEIIDKNRVKEINVTDDEGNVKTFDIGMGVGIAVEDGQRVEVGEQLTAGSVNTHVLLGLKGMGAVQQYLLEEIQRVYRSQGVSINDKHVEVILHQMTKKVKISNPGDSDEVMGEVVEKVYADALNEKLVAKGKEPIDYVQLLMGITETALNSDSFLSAASFQETPKILTEAAIKGKKDFIRGLKEAVILGKKIPAGTGFEEYIS